MSSNNASANSRIREILMRRGINPTTSRQVALNELRGWSATAVEGILDKIKRPSVDHCPLKDTSPDPDEAFIRRQLSGWLPPAWVRPSLDLVRQAVAEKKALCVNRRFQWKLCDSGYYAISHVWGEGIRADFKGRGLTRKHLSRIFQVLDGHEAEWIWLDVLAVPNADPAGLNLSEEEKALQIAVINTLPQVYEGAAAVVVFDALVLQMHGASSTDVAVGLVCGAWISRVWTYQEIRLAKTALVVTADRIFVWDDIMKDLQKLVEDDEASNGRPPRSSIYYSLHLSMVILQYVHNVGLSLTDISFASAARQSTYEIDYARSLFALVNLPWNAEWTSSAPGMQAIYQNRRRDAARLVAMHGVKRMKISPRWAPSRLAGLEGTIHDDMVWEDRGLRGMWHRQQIEEFDEVEAGTKRRIIRLLLGERNSDLWCEVLVGADEEAETIEAFKTAVSKGRAFIICKHRFAEGVGFERGTASQALVVETVDEGEHDEVDVLFATALRGVVGESSDEKMSIVLRH